MKWVFAALFAGIGSCLSGNATYWAPYNGTEDIVSVSVGGDVVGDDISIDLTSTTGATVLGTGTVSPGAGPVGTEHLLTVALESAYAGDVGRVSVEAESVRGVTTHEFVQDSADTGLWVVSVTSLGISDEIREDRFRFVLWQESDKDDPDAVKVD